MSSKKGCGAHKARGPQIPVSGQISVRLVSMGRGWAGTVSDFCNAWCSCSTFNNGCDSASSSTSSLHNGATVHCTHETRLPGHDKLRYVIMNKFEFVGTFSTGRFYSNVREKRKSQNVQKRTKFWLSGKLCKNNFSENYVSGQIP